LRRDTSLVIALTVETGLAGLAAGISYLNLQ
jgi:hypothetical protein